ncbi:hypothetical protein BXZ70DRAFT_915252 [Cristinia sonorae]|uniref:DUF3835 domain-containing protein n=1 Tax=Cristinia sonorae TaxID=1940300 RepID=A0A8K0UX01_9AGAR|nr:hypothetical protein BXZ70DRAFT_915252 [Cristinia sonorae]
MSGIKGTTKNLSESRVQALQAILNSVSPDDEQPAEQQSAKLSDEQIRRISDKLGDIFGEDPQIIDDGTKRNEKGELVNEEGLPIIDINEPDVAFTDAAHAVTDSSFDDPDLLPQWTLSPEEKARRKAERERLLDILEEEERLEAEREEMSERERFQEDLERRKLAARSDLESLKKAKELQKKMGRALVRNVIESKEKKDQEAAQELKDAEAARAAGKPLKSKKSVTFAVDVPQDGSDDQSIGTAGNWEDVIPARMNKGHAPIWASKQPMKMDVVERNTAASLRSPPPRVSAPEPDSDDESVPEGADEDEDYTAGADGSDHESNGFLDDEEPVSDWDDEQFDSARLQREIALEYFEKRKTFGSQVTSAMRAHTHEEVENEWDQPIVPAEATLASPPPKPPVSKFKASLGAPKTSTLASHSLGAYVIPSSQTQVLQRAIRYGKLENGQLVGGEAGESEDEIEGPQLSQDEILKLLSEGAATNIGPAPGSSQKPAIPTTVSQPRLVVSPQISKTLSAASVDSPISDSSTVYSPASTGASTPIALVGRSSPKVSTPMTPSPPVARPAMGSSVVERPRQLVTNGTIVERPARSSQPSSPKVVYPPISSVIESPSFSEKPSGTTPFQSVIIESPSFTTASPAEASPASVDAGAKRTERKKVSRFLAERG